MVPRSHVEGRLLPLDRPDVDTDQIMPKQHLKRVDREGFGEVVFEDWREDPEFVLNDQRFAGANVLVTGRNFGAGSSREHAVWGLQQYGFEALISPRFADIFRNNCERAGLVAIELDVDVVRGLLDLAQAAPETRVSIDLIRQRVEAGPVSAPFDLNPRTKQVLIEGRDFIDVTLQSQELIELYEAERGASLPRIT